ncbi:hypothetical protein TERTU_0777 [Teredinibacter turnerae T7901]|uniref:Uncharacterized protein n=1 Tax=Teredinibacter turnerae (strain ATCC 39867 / T7901) TaxID=377629 RepID=C5BPG3_TERTT|nr:hypothetical protein [Teredinibacter turnerae]ACR12816.1 hypothetical protein TERTU_0777 [Teredinibacter turnerae T7901]
MATAHFQQNSAFRISASELPGQVVAHTEQGRHVFHCCNINGSGCIIFPRNLQRTDPKVFFQLEEFASVNNLRLLEERRSVHTPVGRNKRRPWLPVLLLTITASTAFAEPLPATYWHNSVGLTNTHDAESAADLEVLQQFARLPEEIPAPTAESSAILKILEQHFQPQVDDPFTLQQEFGKLAGYYAQFPPVVQLLQNLASERWKIKYERRSFRTEVTGSAMKVEEATVFFDPQFGARLKFQSSCREKIPYCVASPADALLHEMLHLKTMLLNTSEYIASGGMGGLIYPFEHERKTIEMENELYRAMTDVDGQPRPIRSGHTGRYVMVACATCIE